MRKIAGMTAAALLLCAVAPWAAAQSLPVPGSAAAPTDAAIQATDEVAAFVRYEMQRQHIPGLTLLVSRSGTPIRTEGYGLSNIELNVPARPKSIFQSGSVGKQFTATAIMMLIEAGQVGLDDPLAGLRDANLSLCR
jgi:CubicO group peptidase (beta-lactamase class C family)